MNTNRMNKGGRFWIGVVLVLLGLHTAGMFWAMSLAMGGRQPAPLTVEEGRGGR